jgi:predicted deacylase
MKQEKIHPETPLNSALRKPEQEMIDKIVSTRAGVLLFNKHVGDFVKKDEIVARIFDPKTATLADVKTPFPGQIIGQKSAFLIQEKDVDNTPIYILLKSPGKTRLKLDMGLKI